MGSGASSSNHSAKYAAEPVANGNVGTPRDAEDATMSPVSNDFISRLEHIISAVNSAKNVQADEFKPEIDKIIPLCLEVPLKQYPAFIYKAVQLGTTELCMKYSKDFYKMKNICSPEKENAFNVLVACSFMLMKLTEFSRDACNIIVKGNGLSTLLNVIKSPIIDTSLSADDPLLEKQERVYRSATTVLYTMLLNEDNTVYRNALRDQKAVQIIHEQSKRPGFSVAIRASLVFNLGVLINENESEVLEPDDANVQHMTEFFRNVVKGGFGNYGVSAMTLVTGFNRMALNDQNKARLARCGVIEIYEDLLEEDLSPKEKAEVVHGIWTLAFHKDNKEHIINKTGLISSLHDLKDHEHKKLKDAAQGALWILEGREKKEIKAPKDVHHVMISYNWGVKPIALKIRDQLRADGYKVWMDVDNMTGSTLEAMAEAVENAAVVLICMTQKYKDSPSCRTEAEYTYQLRKEFIPLRLEAGYKADGWLGIMTGTKLWFDFIKNFNGAMSGLTKELGNRGKIDTPIAATSQNELTKTENSNNSSAGNQTYRSWSVLDVANWLKKIGLGHQVSKFSTVDGPLLDEVTAMSRNAPQFFYSYLTGSQMKLSLADVLTLTKSLNTLH